MRPFLRLGSRYNTNMQSVIHSDPQICGGKPVFVGTRVLLDILINLVKNDGKAGLEEFVEGFSISRQNAIEALKERGLLDLVK
jgi:uncharacterized protein (DUF433 family)